MRKVLISLRVIPVFALLVLLHYALPQHDIARITSTEIIRMDFSTFNRMFYEQSDSGVAELQTRDIRLINTQRKKSFLLGFIRREAEGVMVYRNEDTGWFWPPYFKFDSSDLQATAAAKVSAPVLEQWVVITHYGWRNRFFSIYPNAVGIRPVDGPDVQVIPWFNIVFLLMSVFGYFLMRAIWRRFRGRVVVPFLGDAGHAIDRVEDRAIEAKGRINRWFDFLRRKTRR